MEAEIIVLETNQLIETKVIGRDIPGDIRDGEAIKTMLGPRTVVKASTDTKPIPGGFITTVLKVWVK